MPEWLGGTLVGGFLTLITSAVLQWLSVKAHREDQRESRQQNRREAVYFEAMDYFAARISDLQRFALKPWESVDRGVSPGTLGRLELVAGSEVLREARRLTKTIGDSYIAVSTLSPSVVAAKSLLDTFAGSIDVRREQVQAWLDAARNLAIDEHHDRASLAADNALRAQDAVEEIGRRHKLAAIELGERHFELLTEVVKSLPDLAASQSQLAVAIRSELGVPGTPSSLADESKQDATALMNEVLQTIGVLKHRVSEAKAKLQESDN